MPIRTIAPPIKDPATFDVFLPLCNRYTLSNGVEVFALDMGTEDTLMVNWVFYAGNCYEKKKTVAAATNHLLKNGTSRLSAFELNDHFEKAYYSHVLGHRKPDTTGFEIIIRENGLDPAETLFVDDALMNVEGAIKAGLKGLYLPQGITINDIRW